MSEQVKVVVIRHGKKENLGFGTTSWSLQSRLTAAGVETAKQVALRLAALLRGCRWFFCSPLIRAQETCFAVMEALGIEPCHFEERLNFEPGLWSSLPATWYDDCDPQLYSNRRIYQMRPEEVEAEGDTVLDSVKFAAKVLLECGDPVAFCVSHGGPLDAAIMLAKRALGQSVDISDLKEGEGAIFSYDEDENLVAVEDILNP